MPSIYDLSSDELKTLTKNDAPYRYEQLKKGIFEKFQNIVDITDLPKELRAQLSQQFEGSLHIHDKHVTEDGSTTKFVLETSDNTFVETVLMRYKSGATACLSSQVGCAMNCSFCATGQMGYKRSLTVSEIVEQFVIAMRDCIETGERLTNVVFMGMGEPLANYDNVIKAISIMNKDMGFGARRITVSTVGIVPGIIKLAKEPIPVNLAISLHFANNEKRTNLVPINRVHPLEKLQSACQHYFRTTKRRISVEWTMIKGQNDSRNDALELINWARATNAHVNLIRLNPTKGFDGGSPDLSTMQSFQKILINAGITTTIRDTKGRQIAAACGQLATQAAKR